MIFGKGSPYTAHEATYRKIETWGAVLPLIVAVRRKLKNLRGFVLVTQNVYGCLIYFCISAAAFLVVESTGITDPGKHKSVADACGVLTVSRKPGDRTN